MPASRRPGRSVARARGSHWFARALVTTVVMITAINAIRPMVSYRAIELGASPSELGLVAAAYALLSSVIAVPVGRWVDRFAEFRFLMAGSSTVAVTGLALTGLQSIRGLIAAQTVLGAGQILFVVALQSLIARGGDPDQRDARFGAFSVAASIGLTVGPAAGGFVAARGADVAQVFALASALAVCALLGGASLWRRPPHDLERRSARAGEHAQAALPTFLRLFRRPGMAPAMLASLTVLASLDIVVAYLPAYGELHGIPVQTVGLLLASQAATAMAARILMVPLLRMLGRRWLLASSMLASACALAALPIVGARLPVVFVLMAASGVGLGLAQPITMSWVADRTPVDERATALGVRLTGNRLGQLVLPAAVGVVAGAAGLAAIFLALGVMLGGSATLVARTTTS